MTYKAPKRLKLENEPLWKETNALADYIYIKLADMPDSEKWDTSPKLQKTAVDLLFYVAQALGKGSPAAREYEWGEARKHASALKTMYRFAGKQGFLELDPAIMVRLNQVIADIDDELNAAYKQTKDSIDEELAHWRKKYQLWKETINES